VSRFSLLIGLSLLFFWVTAIADTENPSRAVARSEGMAKRAPLGRSPGKPQQRPLEASRFVELVGGSKQSAMRAEQVPLDEARLVGAVRRILPADWKITTVQRGSIPPDWVSTDSAGGLLVQGENDKSSFHIWFLPRDWIGIRKYSGRTGPGICFWEGILDGGTFKTITYSTDTMFYERVWRLEGLSTLTLTNGGFERSLNIFKGRLEEMDRTASGLIRKHCKTAEEFAYAAKWLVMLGVPARSVLRRAAREVESMDRDFFCSVLGHIGDRDCIGVLCELVADPRLEDERKKYAVMALRNARDDRVVPALMAALKQSKHDDVIAYAAQSLAGLRHKGAVPVLKGFLKEYQGRGKEAPEALTIALLRLIAGDAAPGEDRRYFLVPPKNAVLGRPMFLTLYTDNVGKETWWSPTCPDSGLAVDGNEPEPPKLSFGGITCKVAPGQLDQVSWDISHRIRTPGTHVLRYGSAEATFIVSPAKP
jgi:hypothetical protein